MKLQAHIDAELSQTQLEDLAGRPADKRRDLADRAVTLEREIVMKDDCALADGSYGISETTGEPITYARLMLIPWPRAGVIDKKQLE